MKNYLIVIVLFLTLTSCLNHQYLKKGAGLNQTITIVNDTAIIQFNTTKKNVKTWKRREYTWFKSGLIFQTKGYYDGELLDGSYQEENVFDHKIKLIRDYRNGKLLQETNKITMTELDTVYNPHKYLIFIKKVIKSNDTVNY